ncbi:hypothetical protein PENTCL1PPCAC_22580, partial [Pristionchus entomophagus]
QEMEVDRSDDDQTPSTSSITSSIGIQLESLPILPLPPIDLPHFSPHHLQLLSQLNASNWEEWLAWLASSLSPSDWRQFWESYVSLFGVGSLPLNIFPPPLSPTPLQLAVGAH